MKEDYHRQYYLENKQKFLKRSKEWAERNREKRRAIHESWKNRNPEKVKSSSKKWREENREYHAQYRQMHKKELTDEQKRARSLKMKEYRERNADYLREKRRKKYYADVELSRKKSREDNRKNPYRKHRALGITAEEVELARTLQKNLCAICGEKKFLCVDHDHKTNKFRGLLCRQCNAGLGLLKDSPVTVQNALEYLIR